MKWLAIGFSIIVIFLWGYFLLMVTQYIPINIFTLALPKSTAELGDSMGILNGLFSSFAIILALITVLFQSKELRDSTVAQTEQAYALNQQLEHQQKMLSIQLQQSTAIVQQLEQQQISNKIVGLTARQRYLLSEVSRMDGILKDIYGNMEKEELFNNCNAKKKQHQLELSEIDSTIKKLL